MLYIFHVDIGRMMTFDMNLALESVQNLKDTIERHHNINSASQVLLVSGGEMLQSNARVCSYSAGTDTNPIYMFSTSMIESQNPPRPWPSIDADTDLKEKIDSCLELPANYNTVVIRAQLAQQCHEMAKEEIKICEKLVHEQHLQQQGWSAVVANMEDLTEEFNGRCIDFYRSFDDHLKHRKEYLELVTVFNNDLENLSRIPILPGLMQNAEEKPFTAFDDYLNDSEAFGKSDSALGGSSESTKDDVSCEPISENICMNLDTVEKKLKTLSLLQWISASESQKSLRHLAHNCSKGLQLFDEKAMETLKADAQKAIDVAQQENIKEIKGLEDRLYGLEKLIFDAKKLVQEQYELAQAFQQNQIRANNLGDASILPDLCASHCNQLVVMAENHKRLRDIRRRITKAKEELATNLNKRLKYVVYIENRMYDIDNRLLFYHRCLRRLQKHLGIVEQIHEAPSIYVKAVTEVVRRRSFSSAFLMWASNLACQLLTIYNDEVMRRHDFSSIFDGHFLSVLFPGMNDMPPSYATEAPSIFDSSLPHLSKEDINMLSAYLPELTSKVELPDLSAVIDFFSSRSGTLRSQEEKNQLCDSRPIKEEKEPQIGVGKTIEQLKDYERGFESETDTEEFENVGQIPMEKQHGTDSTSETGKSNENQLKKFETNNIGTSTENILTHSMETLTEDNFLTMTCEINKLKDILKVIHGLNFDSLELLRKEVNETKLQTEAGKINLEKELNKFQNVWKLIENVAELREVELRQQMTLDHELELNDIKKNLDLKSEELKTYSNENNMLKEQIIQHQTDNDILKSNLNEFRAKVKLLEERISEAVCDQEKAVNEIKEKLFRSHKTEIESLRCRYKLMTSIERSPSDTSLEKIERPDYIDLNHDSITIHHSATKSALDRERSRKTSYTHGFHSCSPKSPPTNSDFYKRILDEKERQIDALRERELILLKENERLKEHVHSFADTETPDEQMNKLKNQFEDLHMNKVKLEQDLEMEKSRRIELERLTTSRCENKTRNAATSPDLNISQHTRVSKYNISFDSCSRGDTVLVVWNSAHCQYTIVQESAILYFLHGDSYNGLDLTPPTQAGLIPATVYCIGIVIDKEYCHARKNENRYRVQKGTKFYRVKVNPIKHIKTPKRERLDGPATSSSSESVSHSTSTDGNPQYQFIDSFSQTDLLDPVLEDPQIGKDMVDSEISTLPRSIYRERNISVTSVTSVLSDTNSENPYNYINISEEEEKSNQSSTKDDEID